MEHELACAELPAAWADHTAWTILDTDFSDGQRFEQVLHAWQQDPRRPRMLHYVGIATQQPAKLSNTQLARASADLGPGMHRILLEGAQVSLTLCLGTVQAALSEQAFQADTLFTTAPNDKWVAQLLARRCRRATRVVITLVPADAPANATAAALMQAAGFVLQAYPTHLVGSFDPRWTIVNSRTASRHVQPKPGRCAIIGAGLSGASIAQALAVRGWQVTVLDQESAPARGASGLPAGLAVPHVSADDNPRSRLTRSGTRLMADHAQRLLQRGLDWEPSGVRELFPDGESTWHPQAFWLKPAAMVQAWLAQPGIRFVAHATVDRMERDDALWQLLGPDSKDWGQFDMVVLANAMGCAALLRKGLESKAALSPDWLDRLTALHPVYGTASHGTYAETLPDLPTTPVNGNGCFIPHLPGANGEEWLAGATFETDALAASNLVTQHALNMQRLRQLLPMDAYDLADTLDRGPVAQWSSTRCVTHDRLPLVGPIDTACGTGLWICVGMGSRGLSLAALCAELLAARLGAEPLPLESSLARSLGANRVRRKPAATKAE